MEIILKSDGGSESIYSIPYDDICEIIRGISSCLYAQGYALQTILDGMEAYLEQYRED